MAVRSPWMHQTCAGTTGGPRVRVDHPFDGFQPCSPIGTDARLEDASVTSFDRSGWFLLGFPRCLSPTFPCGTQWQHVLVVVSLSAMEILPGRCSAGRVLPHGLVQEGGLVTMGSIDRSDPLRWWRGGSGRGRGWDPSFREGMGGVRVLVFWKDRVDGTG